jgi:hypothetical protein
MNVFICISIPENAQTRVSLQHCLAPVLHDASAAAAAGPNAKLAAPPPPLRPTPPQPSREAEGQLPDLEDFLERRDFVGAITLLSARRAAARGAGAGAGAGADGGAAGRGGGDAQLMEWLAYAHFHYGEHDKVRRHAAFQIACLCTLVERSDGERIARLTATRAAAAGPPTSRFCAHGNTHVRARTLPADRAAGAGGCGAPDARPDPTHPITRPPVPHPRGPPPGAASPPNTRHARWPAPRPAARSLGARSNTQPINQPLSVALPLSITHPPAPSNPLATPDSPKTTQPFPSQARPCSLANLDRLQPLKPSRGPRATPLRPTSLAIKHITLVTPHTPS